MKPRALVFDAYGTLFDVHGVVLCAGDGIAHDSHSLSILWRRKQLEFTWLRALMERYEDFWNVTEAAQRSAVREFKIQAGELPPAFPDVRPGLEYLDGSPLAIWNGTPKMLELAVDCNDLRSCFTEVIFVDRVKTYEPSARVYTFGPHTLNIPAEENLFVSSNPWHAAGAKAFGYRVCWCNRSAAEMEHLAFAPDIPVSELYDLVPVMESLSDWTESAFQA